MVMQRALRPLRRGGRFAVDRFAAACARPLDFSPHRAEVSTVHLTFDDGPHPRYTTAIAESLADAGATATFFFTGQSAKAHAGLVRELFRGGHTIGSHSESHLQPWQTSIAGTLADYRRGHQQVEEALGQETQLFRPPYGHLDCASTLFSTGPRRLVRWSVDPEDWRPGATEDEIVAAVLSSTRNGSIVLLHDNIQDLDEAKDRSATVKALPRILAGLDHKGLAATALPMRF